MTYSSSISLGRQRYARRGQNAVSFTDTKHKIGPVSNTIILIVLTCLVGLVYLTQVTKTNAFGYRINQLQNEQSELKSEHDELEVSSARLQALDTVKNSAVNKGLVSVGPSATLKN